MNGSAILVSRVSCKVSGEVLKRIDLKFVAKELELHQYMLFAHGSDLCHDLELRHAMANCFEALLGALYLDGGIQVDFCI